MNWNIKLSIADRKSPEERLRLVVLTEEETKEQKLMQHLLFCSGSLKIHEKKWNVYFFVLPGLKLKKMYENNPNESNLLKKWK